MPRAARSRPGARDGEVAKLLGAAGYRWVLIETVGVGQTELDIMKIADTTVVVLVPESGDGIQTMKAGLMEVADVFVVNKADRAGAPALMAELKFAATCTPPHTASRRDVEWETPALSLQAQHGVGVPELLADVRATARRWRGAERSPPAGASACGQSWRRCSSTRSAVASTGLCTRDG